MRTPKSILHKIPNILTIFRLALVPVLWVLMLGCKDNQAALFVFMLANFTDILDGYLARKTNSITDFGKLVDPLADKLMVLSVLITLLIRGIIPWPPVLLMTVKEVYMIVSSAILYKRQIVVHSLFVGKFAQTAVCLALFLSFFSDSFATWSFQPHTALLWIGVGAAYTAMFSYINVAIRQLRGLETTYHQRSDS